MKIESLRKFRRIRLNDIHGKITVLGKNDHDTLILNGVVYAVEFDSSKVPFAEMQRLKIFYNLYDIDMVTFKDLIAFRKAEDAANFAKGVKKNLDAVVELI